MRRGARSGFSVALAGVAASALVAGCSAYELAEIHVTQGAPVARASKGSLLMLDGCAGDGYVGVRGDSAAASGHTTVFRRGNSGRSARWAPDRRTGAASPRFPDTRVTLSSSENTSRAELGLVMSALDFVGAHARARSVVDGLEHFARDGSGPRVTVRMERAGGQGAETWLLDRKWALRRMGCGAMLVWEGELAPVLDRLAVVLRGRCAD